MKLRIALTAFVFAAGLWFAAAAGCGGDEPSSGETKPEAPKVTEAKRNEPDRPDAKRIAGDEALGIKFSPDKKTLVSYNRELPQKGYAIPNGVTAIGRSAGRFPRNTA